MREPRVVAQIEKSRPEDDYFEAKVKVLSEMIKHHVKEEEKRSEGLFAQAKEAGLDTGRIEKDLASPEVRATIEENFKLAEAMGMNGTPSYVIGKQVVIGAVGVDNLKEKIGVARCGKAVC